MTEDRPNYGVAVAGREDGPWQGPTIEEWLERFRLNANASPDGTVRVPIRTRSVPDRDTTAFPFVQREEAHAKTTRGQ